jgi:RNA polymerase sigma factor (sigma-70 family)
MVQPQSNGLTSAKIRAALIETYLEKRLDLKRFLRARLGDEARAEDVVQEIYLRLQAARLEQEVANPVAFLYRIAANLAVDVRRQRGREVVRETHWVELTTHKIAADYVEDRPSPEEVLDSKARLERLVAAVGELPPQCRTVFTLHKLEGLSHAEVSAKVGISRKTVEKHMSRALRQLAEALGQEQS